MKIEFENEPFAIDKWLAGEITVDVGNDLEYKEEIYPFTLFASSDNGVLEIVIPKLKDDVSKKSKEIK